MVRRHCRRISSYIFVTSRVYWTVSAVTNVVSGANFRSLHACR